MVPRIILVTCAKKKFSQFGGSNGTGPPQSKILATPMPESMAEED